MSFRLASASVTWNDFERTYPDYIPSGGGRRGRRGARAPGGTFQRAAFQGKQEAQLLLGDRATRKHTKDS